MFFKGGSISHNVDVKSSQTFTFKVGERAFGEATVTGLKAAGYTNVKAILKGE